MQIFPLQVGGEKKKILQFELILSSLILNSELSFFFFFLNPHIRNGILCQRDVFYSLTIADKQTQDRQTSIDLCEVLRLKQNTMVITGFIAQDVCCEKLNLLDNLGFHPPAFPFQMLYKGIIYAVQRSINSVHETHLLTKVCFRMLSSLIKIYK